MIVFITFAMILWSMLWANLRNDTVERLLGEGFKSEEITTFIGAIVVLAMDFVFFPILYATEHTPAYKTVLTLTLLPVAPILALLWALNIIEIKLKGQTV